MSAPAIPPGYGARHAQPIEALIASVDERLRSFNVFGDQPPAQVEQAPADIEAVRAVGALLQQPDFAVLLEYVADKTVRQPSALPAAMDPMRGWAEAQRREGRNDTLFLVLALIAAAREEPAPAREGIPS